jgi:hypothetical protein
MRNVQTGRLVRVLLWQQTVDTRHGSITLVLLPRGETLVNASIHSDPPHFAGSVQSSPSAVLRFLKNWLEAEAIENLTVVVRRSGALIAAWSSSSHSIALYWTAIALGKAWSIQPRCGTDAREPTLESNAT